MSYLYGGRNGDRPAAITPTSVICQDLMDAAETWFPEGHTNPEAMARLALAGHEIAGFDCVMPSFSVLQEAAALGAEVDWGRPDMMPEGKTFPYADFSDIKVPENILEKPSIAVVLRALEILRRQVGGKVTIVGKFMGPWTQSFHVAGVQNFLLAIGRKKYDMVKKMLASLVPVAVKVANAQFKAGADVVVMSDHATGNLVGPNHYRDILWSFHKELFPQINGPVMLHCCGRILDRLDYFAQTGADAFHFESANNATEALKVVNGRITLSGNINCPHTLLGSPEDVHKEVRAAIAAGIRLVSPECVVPLTTPLANLKALVEAVKEGF